MTVDVMALLAEAAPQEGQKCHTCRWLETRDADERAQWERAMADRSFGNPQMARAMLAADPEAPGTASVENHRRGHVRNRNQGGHRR